MDRQGRAARGATTICRSLGVALLGGGTLAWPAQAASEVEVLRQALSAPATQAALAAVQARGEAEGTLPPLLSNPELTGRHEQLSGGTGGSTDAVGGALRLDLGFSALASREAADLRSQARPGRTRLAVLEIVCAVRADALDQWLAQEQLGAMEAAAGRLESLERTLGRLAEAGEASRYDRDRLALARLSAGVERDGHRVEAARASAALAAWTGAPVEGLTLAPAATLDAGAVERALAADPALTALRLEQEAAGSALGAARRSSLPDLVVEGGARWDSPGAGGAGSPGFEIGGALELPIFDGNRGGQAQARAELAEAEAAVLRREAELRARVGAARRTAEALGAGPSPLNAEAVWVGATARYAQGEASIDELLEAARDVADASAAMAVGEAMRRRAALDLSCAVGAFPEPEIQSLYEEFAR